MARALRWPVTLIRVTKNVLCNFFDPPVLALTYHRVSRLKSDPQLLVVTPEHFRIQMQFLKKNFPIVRFEDDWSNIREPSVTITFDDGYADNVLEALPILEEAGVPATFFVSTGTIGANQEFWWDELELILFGDRIFPERFDLDDERFGRSWTTKTVAERNALYETLLPLMKKVSIAKRCQWLKQLRQWAKTRDEKRKINRAMTVDELKTLGRSKWTTIGAHTVTHTPLSSLSVAEQQQEIIESKKQLETWLDSNVKVFSYPFGQLGDYTQETVDLCRQAGFVKAAANFPGQIHRWTDLYQIPRLVIRNWPLDIFIKHLRRFWIV